ncbi:Homeobox protein yox1 [Cladophialophora chaetospira]|uniref:Homeobox protein yox1 n=1 Tax=Cladophialophora chaetospira TaxID=386627 RepID=A0AA39CNT7_9EURO|nr:Homeobox protein yox1 [Cladophialophora chaetospira]
MGEEARKATEPAATQHAHYAFQLHPTRISPPALPGEASGVKAKRRRTSPQDHVVLEAAYQKNSKPDKVQRAQIVAQVSLGEKEVQIWFQNRRQNDRRRSKPLEPHELVAHLRNNTASPAPPQIGSSSPPENSATSDTRPPASLAPSEPINRPASRASSIHDLLNPSPSGETSPNHSIQGALDSTTPSTSFGDDAISTTNDRPAIKATNGIPEDTERTSETNSDQGSARKRNHAEMAGMRPVGSDLGEESNNKETSRFKPLARTSSFVRLAMTVDGAVKVRTREEDTPSPEKPRPSSLTTQGKTKAPMFRSKSALNSIEIYSDGNQGTSSRAIGAGFGRSRDARTWEFYCDSSTKDALSTQAEAETSGSAVSAINLIRSNSFKSRTQALSPSLSKTNIHPTSSRGSKPKLSRAKSSLGRLQGEDPPTGPVNEKPNAHPGHLRSPSEDSDKENWAPGTTSSVHALRRTEPSGHQRPILQENEDMTFPDASSSRKQGREVPSNRPSPTKEKAKGEEMDCIQGLLSLSQGAWTMK